MVTASILGASGYTGGELLRLLIQHPDVDVVSATSQQFATQAVHRAHPNLRGATKLKFVPRTGLQPADVVFTCVPHGEAMNVVPTLIEQGSRVVDLSADYRLRDAATYESWYGKTHASPALVEEAVYGLPELHREQLPKARLVSGVGCTATATNLAAYPLVKAGWVTDGPIVADIKIGSSAGGLEANLASIHAERSGALRLYAPSSHRHVAEVQQELSINGHAPRIHFTGHAVEMVRGLLSTCHVFLDAPPDGLDERTIWKAYREAYGGEPFIRLVKDRQGIHRFPDPKLVAGSNYADVGFEWEEGTNRVVAVCAIDNLVKGAAGSAVQSMNLMFGLNETSGLTQLPLHPV